MADQVDFLYNVEAMISRQIMEAMQDTVRTNTPRLTRTFRAKADAALDRFFKGLSYYIVDAPGEMPAFMDDALGGQSGVAEWLGVHWESLNRQYVAQKKGGNDTFFMYVELARKARNSKASRRLRRKQIGTAQQQRTSLRRTLATLGNPERYFGKTEIDIEVDQGKTDRSGRRYTASRPYDVVSRNNKIYLSDLQLGVKIRLQFFPNLAGVELFERNAVERFLPRVNKLPAKLVNSPEAGRKPSSPKKEQPSNVRRYDMDRSIKRAPAARKTRRAPYRPLIGPYISWYVQANLQGVVDAALREANLR